MVTERGQGVVPPSPPLLRVGSGGLGMPAGVAEEWSPEKRGFERQDPEGEKVVLSKPHPLRLYKCKETLGRKEAPPSFSSLPPSP